MFAVGVEVEDALDEVLAEHFWVLLQQQVEKAVFTQTGTGHKRCTGFSLFQNMLPKLTYHPGSGIIGH